jgi:ATP/ADP translocase/HEAT repeat protein
LLSRLLHIRDGEHYRAWLMFLYSMTAVGAFITARIVRDALFLSKSDLSVLPYLYVSVFVAVSVPSIIYGRISERYRRDTLILVLTAIFLVSLVLSWAFVRHIAASGIEGSHWFYAVFYVWVEVVGAFLMIQFFTFAADIFTSRESKRLLPFILGGGTLANIIFGFGNRALVKQFDVPTIDLIYVAAGCLVAAMMCVFLLGRSERDALNRAISGRRSRQAVGKKGGATPARSRGAFAALPTKHVRFIAMIVVITFLTTQFIDFTFKALAKVQYQDTMDELGGFFSNFYGFVGIISVIFQFGITRRLLDRFGVLVALLMLPMALFFGSGSLAVLSVAGSSISVLFLAATIAQGASAGLRYTIYDSTMQLIYTPLASAVRSRAKSFIDGILKPAAIGTAGIGLLVLTEVVGLQGESIALIGFGTLIFSAGWIMLLVGVRKEYVRTLMSTLASKRLDFGANSPELDTPQTIRVLKKELTSSNERSILHALELSARVLSPGIDDALAPLVRHDLPAIRRGALNALGHRGAWQHVEVVHQALSDAEPEVRAAAVTSFCAVARDKAIEAGSDLLADPDHEVRQAAIAGLIQHGGLDGILKAAEPLKRLLESEHTADRVSAAHVLRTIEVSSFYQPVLRLLNDEAPEVVIAALQAAGAMSTNELLPPVIYALERPAYRNHAARALIAMGDTVVPLLDKVMGNDSERGSVRSQVPRILSFINTPAATAVLLHHFGRASSVQRYRIATALARLRGSNPRLAPNKAQVLTFLGEELETAYGYLAIRADLARDERLEALSSAMGDRLSYARRRIFRLLSLIHDPGTIQTIARNLESSDASVRDNAVEILDDLCATPIRKSLINLVDRSPDKAKLQVVSSDYDLPRRDPEQRLQELLHDDEGFVVACAAHLMGQRGATPHVEQLRPLLKHEDALTREAAAQALLRIAGSKALEWIGALRNDPSKAVRSFVAAHTPEATPC